jgi:hypothetical protein
VASNYPEEGRSASEDGDEPLRLPFRASSSDYPEPIEARAELRDRETYYTELRLAVHTQSRSHPATPVAPWIPASRTPLDDQRPDTWTRTNPTQDESWDDMIARFGDTWT